MHSTTDQLTALQRIAAFSAELRGHNLGAWRMIDDVPVASCIYCGRELRLHGSLIEPDMDGPLLEDVCVRKAAEAA